VNANYAVVAARAAHRCEYCLAPEAILNLALEVEHIIPTSRGGSDKSDNLALACRACNLAKSNFLVAHDPQTGAKVGLFHPRSDEWSDHFRVDHQSGEISGLTDVGRATVERLNMNAGFQCRARRLWASFELYP
jgi:hypothetical protein